MSFWEWLYRAGPGWPSERQWVTGGLFGSFWAMLQMAVNDPALWNVKLFEVVFQAIPLTGILNMVVAFFYAANKNDETRAGNTGKLADAMKATAEAASTTATMQANIQNPPAAAQADKADEIGGDRQAVPGEYPK